MKAPTHGWILVIIISLTIFVINTQVGKAENLSGIEEGFPPKCEGKFKDKEPSSGELKAVLAAHNTWLYFYRRGFGEEDWVNEEAQIEARRANLCGANLRRARLRGANLKMANLKGANLNGATLSGANLSEAILSQASLHRANLSGANLNGTSLRGADLSEANLGEAKLLAADLFGANMEGANLMGSDMDGANLSGANLHEANLTEAHLSDGANLSGANLYGANLSGAYLQEANLSRVVFEPGNLPEVDKIAYARNFSTMVFLSSPQAMVKVRKAFKEGGYYQQEREVTCAIQRNVTRMLWETKQSDVASLFEALFRYIFFDLTSQYGMTPGRALLLIFILIPIFSFPYILVLHLPGRNGIWRKWVADRIRLDLGANEPTRLQVGWRLSLFWGLYFSILSAFNIGWREFNVGNWIQRLQAQEYILKATGWVRSVAGVQSLVSAYLLAIWALTYFGRPFE